MERKVLTPRRATRVLLEHRGGRVDRIRIHRMQRVEQSLDASGGSQPLTMYNDNPQWKDGFVKAGDEIAKTTGYSLNPISLPSTANYTQTRARPSADEQVG